LAIAIRKSDIAYIQKNECESSFGVKEHTQYGIHTRRKKEKPQVHAEKSATNMVWHSVYALKL